MEHYRPIVSANLKFKIITKAFADRLATTMSKIIYPHQMSFIQGRYICDCICLILEGINMLRLKPFVGNLALKIDTRKTFELHIGLSLSKFFRRLVSTLRFVIGLELMSSLLSFPYLLIARLLVSFLVKEGLGKGVIYLIFYFAWLKRFLAEL